MRNSLKTTKLTGIMVLVIGVLIIGAVVFATAGEWSKPGGLTITGTPTPTSTPTATPVPVNGDTTKDIIILSVDTEASVIRGFNAEDDEYLDLTFSGSTDIRSKFGQVISARVLERGIIAEASFNKADNQLRHLYISNDSWKYEKPLSWKTDMNSGLMRIGDLNYRIFEDVPTYADDGDYDLNQLSGMDVINVIGKGTYVFGIELVSGHGTLYAMNERDFIGGSLFVNDVYAGQITEGFRLSIREGEYEISFSCGELNGKQGIVMKRNGIAVVDMGPFVEKKQDFGIIDFMIAPANADLFVDSKFYSKHTGVKLAYGQHVVEVSLQGYSTWTGIINVEKEQQDFVVELVERFVATPTPTAVPFFELPTPTPVPGEPEPTETPTPTPSPSPTPTVTPTPDPDVTPSPTPTQDPDATPTPTPDPNEEKPTSVDTVIVWYPNSVITLDNVYAGMTNDAGELPLTLSFGKHIIGCTRLTLESVSVPKNYTFDVNENTPARVKFPTP